MSTEPTTQGSPAPVKEGDVLAAKYRVEKVLGVGGMGVVVAAEHIELSQKVALKFLLKQAAANDDLVQRFLREARASVRLKGAHVAKTLDVGRLEDGCPYIVMEFLEGHDLHAEIRGGKGLLSVEDAASYVVQAAEGLAEAHSLGIVHRDLKPGNLFLTRGVDGRPLVKVLDFGISKTMDPGAGGDGLSLTKTEMLLGSPLYMSPEQMRSSKHVDERSDLWALGCIAFELLTGHVPFEADTILELCFKVAQEKAPSPALLRPDLPEALCKAVMRCLEKSPEDRFANVGELAQAFEPFALARDRGTAERALDVLGTGRRPPMRSISPEVAALAPVTPAPAAAPTPTPAPTPAPGVPQATPSQVEPIAPAAAWGTTQAQPANRSKKGLFAIVGAVVVLASVAGVVVSRRGSTTAANALVPSSTSSTTAVTGAAAAGSAPAPSEPAPVPTALAVVDAGVAPVASTSPATPALTAHVPGTSGNKPVVKAAPSSVASAASSKGTKPATSATPPVAPTGDPAGFIKVRE